MSTEESSLQYCDGETIESRCVKLERSRLAGVTMGETDDLLSYSLRPLSGSQGRIENILPHVAEYRSQFRAIGPVHAREGELLEAQLMQPASKRRSGRSGPRDRSPACVVRRATRCPRSG